MEEPLKEKSYTEDADSILLEILNVTDSFSEPPVILSRIIELTNDPKTSVKQIVEALSTSPSVTTRVLRLSNSAFYGFSRKIASIYDAVVLLGLHTVRSMVIVSTAYSLFFKPGSAGRMYKGLWEHSLAVAIFSRILAQREKSCHPEEAYIAGLLHDMGKIVMLDRFRGPYQDIIRDSDSDGHTLLQKEEAVFGFSHPFVAAILVEKWKLPENIVDAVAMHHVARSLDSIAGIVAMANIFVTTQGINIHAATEEEQALIKDFGWDEAPERFREVVDDQLGLFRFP